MMDAALWNLVPYSAQVAIIAGLGAALSTLLRIDAAAVRYHYWRALLALCVGLPWLQGRQTALVTDEITAAVLVPHAAEAAASIDAAAFTDVPWLAWLAAVLVGGAVLRLLWIGIGLRRLSRLRHEGSAVCHDHHEELQRLIGTRAEIRYVPGLRQPITFGVRRPVVLLPDTLAQRAGIERAVLAHELFHVRRRDWLWLLLEEGVRAALWFHPAIWWLVSRVQLAREEVVDELAVLATGGRRTYMQALLTFADETPLAPATAFARRHHLFRRIVLLSREAPMSSKRIVLSCALLALCVSVGSWSAMHVFPLTTTAAAQEAQNAPGPLERRANPITPENPIPRRLFSVGALYPSEALAANVLATVTLRVVIDERGRVAEARQLGAGLLGGTIRMEDGRVTVEGQVIAPAGDEGKRLGEAFTRAAIAAVRQWQYDQPANAPIAFQVTLAFAPGADGTLVSQSDGISTMTVTTGTGGATSNRPLRDAGALRVGGNIRAPVKVKDVRPVYPAVAQTARVQGVVIIEALIGADGRVEDARILRSIPLLDQAALDAVMQWEFTPTLLNGQPTPIIMTMTVQFTLT